MTPGQLRNNAAHWLPSDRRITDHAPSDTSRNTPVSMLGWALIGAGTWIVIAAATPTGRALLAMVAAS
jgi:hypothetical protein